jgi:hypothetical protein
MCKASSSSQISALGMRLPRFFTNRRTHRSSRREKPWKHTLALIEGPQGADSGPEAVDSLGHQHQNISFHLGTRLLADFARIQSRKLRVFLTPDTYTGVLLRRSEGELLCPIGRWRKWCHWARRSAARTRHRVPWERCALKLLTSRQRVPAQCRYIWLWAWASNLACLARRVEHPIVRQQWCPPWRPSPLGDLDTGGVPRDALSSLPLLPSWEVPFFSGKRCREIHPSSRPFNRSPGHYPGVRRANLSVANLPAEKRGLFVCGGDGFFHRALGGASLCLCRQRRGSGSEKWPRHRAPSGRFHGSARVGRVQLVGFALARGGSGGHLGDRSLPPPRQSRIGTHWSGQRFVRPTL